MRPNGSTFPVAQYTRSAPAGALRTVASARVDVLNQPMGPRQVGKTTTARRCAASLPSHDYLTWDDPEDRRCILAGPRAVAERLSLDRLRESPPVCVLDEIHKYGRWKGFLKGFFDRYAGRVRVVVTGSARLDVFRSGGDSLMGRYFGYRMHPLSVAEVVSAELPVGLAPREPRPIDDAAFDALLRLGGFPEPFLRRDRRFWGRWRRQRSRVVFREDLRDLTRVRELGQVEVLAELVRRQVGQLVSYSSFSRAIGASVDSVRRWLQTLESLFGTRTRGRWTSSSCVMESRGFS